MDLKKSSKTILYFVLIIFLFMNGCSEEKGLNNDILLTGNSDRMISPGNFFNDLMKSITVDISENHSLRQLFFINGESKKVYDYLFNYLFNHINSINVDAEKFNLIYSNLYYTVEFNFVITGFTNNGYFDYRFVFPVKWNFFFNDSKLSFIKDGMDEVTIINGYVKSEDNFLEGVKIINNDVTVSTTDNDGFYHIILNNNTDHNIKFSRPGFEDHNITFSTATGEIKLENINMKMVDGYFLKPVNNLRISSLNRGVKLFWNYEDPVDKFILFRRSNGHYAKITEIESNENQYLDMNELINGKRYLYKLIPYDGENTSFLNPVLLGIPSILNYEFQFENYMKENTGFILKGETPWIEKHDFHYKDEYIVFKTEKTQKINILTENNMEAGLYTIIVNLMKNYNGGKFQINISQFGESEEKIFQSFIIDTMSNKENRISIDLGNILLQPVNWQSKPINSSKYNIEIDIINSHKKNETIMLDSVNFIKIN